ncbi:MAG: S8 family serine peptidase, partial [Acidimicrobiales bacterium]
MGNAGVLAVVMLLSAAVPGQAGEPVWNVARVGGPVPVAGAVVAVVDSGVDAGHPTFGGRVLAAIDLVGGSGGDPNGHGTHVAGTAGGGDAGPGVGVAPAVSILPVRVLGPDGSGQLSTVAEGIRRATDAGADVINLSLGDDVVILNPTRQALADAIHYAWSRGAICVLAAGNEGLLGVLGSGYGDLPAVVVTATGFDDRLAPYATRLGNVRWGLSAPGGDGRGDDHDILSAWPGGTYARMAGTSMAAPHVSGALAVLRSLGLDPTAAVHRLLGTARPIGPAGTYGSGLLDLGAAVSDLAVPTSTAPPQPVPPGVGQEPAT